MTETEYKQLIVVTQVPIGGIPVQAADARELHAFLGVRKAFTNWMKAQITRARLVANRDFLLQGGEEVYAQKGKNPFGGRPLVEYWLTLDAAKHIAMMAGTEKGFQVREYFIECERQARAPARPEPETPWNERPLEERRVELATISMYLRTANPASAWWYARNHSRVPIPPRKLQPAWWQADADLGGPLERDVEKNPSVDINLNVSGFSNGNGSGH